MLEALLVNVLLTASIAPTLSRPKLAVMELSLSGGISADVAGPMTEAITNEISARGFFDVLSSRDIQTLLGRERQRQLMGCSDSSCAVELAGALGARFVMSGSLAKLGDTYQLTLQTLDSQKAVPVGRSTRLAKDLSTLRTQLPWAIADATGTPPPPPPSHLLPYVLIGAGAAAVVGGAVLGLSANSEGATIRSELAQADINPNYRLLRSASQYQSDVLRLQLETALAIGAVVAGVGAIGLGVYVNPAETGSGRVALLPTSSGFAMAGTW